MTLSIRPARPGDAPLRNNLANALVEAGRAPEAETHLRTAVGRNFRNFELMVTMGQPVTVMPS